MNSIMSTTLYNRKKTMKQSTFKILVTILFLLLFTQTNAEQSNQSSNITPESEQLVKDLQQQLQSTIAAITEIENKAGNSVKDLHFQVGLPAKQSPNLGLVLDLDSIAKGYKILSVTPGSYADKLNLKPGYLIIAINDIPVDNSEKRRAFSELENAIAGDSLRLTIDKNGKTETFESIVIGKYTPSIKLEIGAESTKDRFNDTVQTDEAGCGKVSVFFTPPSSKQFYHAKIFQIDEQRVNSTRETFRLKPGKHIIHLKEYINDYLFVRRFRSPQGSKLSNWTDRTNDFKWSTRRNKRFHGVAKSIEIDIKPNVTYNLAAKFIKDKQFKQRSGEYWEPVVWKETVNDECEL